MCTFSFQVLQNTVLILNFSGLCLVPVIQIQKCDDGFGFFFKKKRGGKKEYDGLQRTELSKLMTSL